MMEDMGESVVGMDGPDDVARAMRTLDDWADVTPPVNGAMEAPDAVQGTVPDRDAGASPGNVPGVAQDRRAEQPSPAEERGSPPALRGPDARRGEVAERGREGSADPAERGRTGARDTGRLPADLKG